ncbi:hypothetical protein [Cytobacillus oceanisediminis]|uniref:hypothetical protein n=1 Tax=Cytobacillus oceanisediminis TaxID=665099 RepID=UPI00373707EF
MKFQQSDFTDELKEKIKDTELALKKHVEKLENENRSVFANKNLILDAGFDKGGSGNPFMPGYGSSVSIGIADENDELIDFHIMKIWECQRIFLGLPVSKKIPGSKVIGEFLDETYEEVKEELKEYVDEFLMG